MASHGGRRCCGWCKFLYGLVTESIIITLTFIHALSTVVEVLIYLQIITNPISTASTKSPVATPANNSSNTSISNFDPGGDKCQRPDLDRNLEIAAQVFRYFTLVVSSLFILEVFLKMIYSRIAFIKDPWQIVDLLVVMTSLGLEITFYILKDKVICVHPEVELAALIILFRLWRIPRACNIQKEEYAKRLESEMYYLRNEKINQERKFKELEERVEKQKQELKQHENSQAKYNGIVVNTNDISQCNGSTQTGTLYEKAQAKLHEEHQSKYSKSRNATLVSNGDVPRSTTEQSKEEDNQKRDSKDRESENGPKGHNEDIGPRDKDVYDTCDGPMSNDYVFVDSDSSGTPHHHLVQKVEVQIEEAHRQHELPSVSYVDHEVMMRKRLDQSVVGMDNRGFEHSDEHDTEMDLMAVIDDGTRTYRSADGIPMTDL